jgi:fatty acid amide hydrolase 2
MDPLLTRSATRLAAMIKAREVSSQEVTEAHIRHIERVNPALNAVVRDRFAEAREEARAADLRVKEGQKGDLPPLHGVPCSIKETFALQGMPITAGLVARKGKVSERDGLAVARLREAGAIPLGVTNISELCMWMESNNRVYGRTNNPYDPRRIVGGSSGGEGAIVGAGGAPFGLGSDIGGSIRMPAFFNGVFGHKATGGAVPNDGQFPLPADAAMGFLSTGPLARRAEDLAPLVNILAGKTFVDPSAVDVGSLTVTSVEESGTIPVSEELRAAQRACVEALRARGAAVRTAHLKNLQHSLEIWGAMLDAAGGESFSSLLGCGTPIHAGYELFRWALGRSPHTLPALGLALVEKIPKLFPSRGRRFVELGRELRRELVELIGPRGVMLYPSYPTPAPLHYKPLLPPFNWVYTAVFNVMEVPATQVPLGLGKSGVPLGVQVIGAHGGDALTIAVALELERAFGGWVPPPRLAA